jgi:hypothetical protein
VPSLSKTAARCSWPMGWYRADRGCPSRGRVAVTADAGHQSPPSGRIHHSGRLSMAWKKSACGWRTASNTATTSLAALTASVHSRMTSAEFGMRLPSDQLSPAASTTVHSGTPPRTEFTLSSRPRRLTDRASGRRDRCFKSCHLDHCSALSEHFASGARAGLAVPRSRWQGSRTVSTRRAAPAGGRELVGTGSAVRPGPGAFRPGPVGCPAGPVTPSPRTPSPPDRRGRDPANMYGGGRERSEVRPPAVSAMP